MTDIIRTSELSIEDRLDLLESRLGVAGPLALVPPITIGSLTNVPTPGSQIAAQWAQDVSGIALHRFASKASLDAWAAPNGAYGVTVDGILWRRVGGAWSRVTPWSAIVAGIATFANGLGEPGAGGVARTLASVVVPADPAVRLLDVSCSVRIENQTYLTYINLTIGAGAIAQFQSQTLNGSVHCSLRATYLLPAGAPATVGTSIQHYGPTYQTAQTYADLFLNRLDVVVGPVSA
jgi:hypothetical protein